MVLLVIGPAVSRGWHGWSYEEAVYFTFITMTTIGYGDFYPGSDESDYMSSADADPADHPVQIWCEGVFVIGCTLSVFSFAYAAVSDWYQERKEAKLVELADDGEDDDEDRRVCVDEGP